VLRIHQRPARATSGAACAAKHRPDFKPRFADMFGDEGEQIFDYL
jgi:hypothetical protein